MDQIVKLNNQTIGRDKLARLLQYASRVAWYYMHRFNATHKSVDTVKSLEFTLSTFRKLLRMGRFMDTLYSIHESYEDYDQLVALFVCTSSKIAHAAYLFCDHLLWAARAGFSNIDTEKWGQRAYKCWLFSVTMDLVRDYAVTIQLLIDHNNMKWCDVHGHRISLYHLFFHKKKEVVVSTLKDNCDFLISLAALGYVKLSPGMVGILGVVSSLAGMAPIVNPIYIMTPE